VLAGVLALMAKYVFDTITDRVPFNYEPYRELTPRTIYEKQRQFTDWEKRERERRQRERDLVRRGQKGDQTREEWQPGKPGK
jgi:hypothetical protein